MPTVRVLKLHPEARLPHYAHSGPYGDLAADLYACVAITLAPSGHYGATQPVEIGIALEFPPDYGALVEDRSGLALHGVTALAGVIDPGYRGEIKVVLTNLTAAPVDIHPGHRIAQLRIVQRIEATFIETDAIEGTARNRSGFGSTGV
jgi:dUTP pyrophosphatase